jgi:hypothetical protein
VAAANYALVQRWKRGGLLGRCWATRPSGPAAAGENKKKKGEWLLGSVGRNEGSEQKMFCEFLVAEVNELKWKFEFE